MLSMTRPLMGVILCFSLTGTLRAQGEVAIPKEPASPIAIDLLIREDQELPLDPVSPPDRIRAVQPSPPVPGIGVDACDDSCSNSQVLRRTFREIRDLERKTTQRRVLNNVYIKPDQDKENEQIRELWKEFFGGRDVWAPYYKAKEIEDWVKERVSFRVLKMKCKPKFDKDGFVYVCKNRF